MYIKRLIYIHIHWYIGLGIQLFPNAEFNLRFADCNSTDLYNITTVKRYDTFHHYYYYFISICDVNVIENMDNNRIKYNFFNR